MCELWPHLSVPRGQKIFYIVSHWQLCQISISCMPGLLLRDGCERGRLCVSPWSSVIICLSKALLRENTLTKSTFFKIIFELLLAPPLFCLIGGCSRHWVGNLCLGFHRGIRVWSQFSLCLSFVTCVTWNTQAAGQLGNLKSHFKNCKTDEYFRSALLVLKGFCRWWV